VQVVLEQVEPFVHREARAAEEQLLRFGERGREDVVIAAMHETAQDLFEAGPGELIRRRQRCDVASGPLAAPRPDPVLLGAERQQRELAHACLSAANHLMRGPTVRSPR
jgi:hypothetical protein